MKNTLALLVVALAVVSARADMTITEAAETGAAIAAKARGADRLTVVHYAGLTNAYVITGCDRYSNSKRRSVASVTRGIVTRHNGKIDAPIQKTQIASPAYPDLPSASFVLTSILSQRSVDGPAAHYSAFELALSENKAPELDVAVVEAIKALGLQGAVVVFTYDSCGIPASRR